MELEGIQNRCLITLVVAERGTYFIFHKEPDCDELWMWPDLVVLCKKRHDSRTAKSPEIQLRGQCHCDKR